MELGLCYLYDEVSNSIAGRYMAQAVIRRPVTSEARVQSQVNLCWVYGGKSGLGTGMSLRISVFPLSVSLHQCSIFIHLSISDASELSNRPKLLNNTLKYGSVVERQFFTCLDYVA